MADGPPHSIPSFLSGTNCPLQLEQWNGVSVHVCSVVLITGVVMFYCCYDVNNGVVAGGGQGKGQIFALNFGRRKMSEKFWSNKPSFLRNLEQQN